MARTKQKTTVEKIEIVKKAIAQKQSELDKLEAELVSLLNMKKEEDKEEIYKKMIDKGLSVEDLKKIIDNKK